jgi:hypothetical protein
MPNPAKTLAVILSIAFTIPVASANDLFKMLSAPKTTWSMSHICVIDEVTVNKKFTNQDFVDAILLFSKTRWDDSRKALKNNDKETAAFQVELLSHTIIDLHWPDRVRRNQDGMIVGFRKCSEFGGGKEIVRQESAPSKGIQNDTAFKKRAMDAVAEVLKKYKDERPFAEVAKFLKAGPLRLAPGYENKLLGNP